MKITKLEKNLMLSKAQEKVDLLQVVADAGMKYNSDNREMNQYDLKRAKEKLAELQAQL